MAQLHFSHWPRCIGSVGTGGVGREQVEPGSSLKHERRVQEGREPRENKRAGEGCWKSGGGRVRLYTWRRAGLADEVRSMPDAAGGEGGHGAARSGSCNS